MKYNYSTETYCSYGLIIFLPLLVCIIPQTLKLIWNIMILGLGLCCNEYIPFL